MKVWNSTNDLWWILAGLAFFCWQDHAADPQASGAFGSILFVHGLAVTTTTTVTPLRGGGGRPSLLATSSSLGIFSKLYSTQNRENDTADTTGSTTTMEEESTSESSSLSLAAAETTPNAIATTNEKLTPVITSILQKASAPLTVILATGMTYFFNNQMAMGPIFASSLVGLASTLTLPLPYALLAFCGSFCGMVRSTVIPATFPAVWVLGCLCAITTTLFDRHQWQVGVGGRLGLMAQIACTTQFLLGGLCASILGWKNIILSNAGGGGAVAKLVDWSVYSSFSPSSLRLKSFALTLFGTIAGALLMSYWKNTMERLVEQQSKQQHQTQKHSNNAAISTTILTKLSTSVAAVSVTGLVLSWMVPSLAGPAFCGAFVAMSSPQKLETYGGLLGASWMAAVSQEWALAGMLLGGWGGKLGTAAWMGVVSYQSLVSLRKKYVRMTRTTTTTRTTTNPADETTTSSTMAM